MGAPEVAKKALKDADEYGLSHDSYKEFHPLIIYYSKQVGPGQYCCVVWAQNTLARSRALASFPSRAIHG